MTTPKKDLDAIIATLKKDGVESAREFDEAMGEVLTTVGEVRNAATSMVETFMSGFGNLSIQSIIGHVDAMSKLSAEMNKATGQAGNLGAALKEHRKAADGMAVGYAELTQHMTAVYTGMTDFSKLSPKMQGELAGLVSKMTKLGIGADETTKNLDIMTRGMGLTAKQAAKTSMDLAKMARGMGVAPKKMAADYAAAAPKLAGYGNRAFSVFKKLAGQAKATGLEMNELLSVTDKFDTFEGAAEQTAQLNAIMGTTMNSVDMLMASEDERIKIMKSEIDATGKRWESMGKFERKALANIAVQGDMEKAARLFGTAMTDIEKEEAKADPALVSQEALNDAMKRGVSRGEAFAAMLEGVRSKFAAAYMPLVNMFTKFFIKDVLPKLTEFLKWIELKIKSVAKALDDMGEEGQALKQMLAWVIAIAVGIGPLLGVLGAIIPMLLSIGGLVTAIFSPWALVLIPIAMGIFMIWENWEKVGGALTNFLNVSWPAFRGGFMAGWSEMWGGVKTVWVDVWNELQALFLDVAKELGLTTKTGTTDWKAMGKTVAKVIGMIMTAIGKLAKLWIGDFRKMAVQSGGVIDRLKAFFGPGGADLMFHTFSLVFLEKVVRPMASFADRILGSPVWSRVMAVALGYDLVGGADKMRKDFGLDRGQTFESLLNLRVKATEKKMRESRAENKRLNELAARKPESNKLKEAKAVIAKVKTKTAPSTPSTRTTTEAAAATTAVAAQPEAAQSRFVIYIDGAKFVDKVINPYRNAIYGFGTPP